MICVAAAACSRAAAGEKAQAEYDPQTGRLQKLTYDANQDGTRDTVSYMDGTRIVRIEMDLDENGQVERWDFYRPDRMLDRIGFASKNDGVMDSQAFYHADHTLERIEVSTKRDGRFDRTEYYLQDHGNNVLDHAATDRDGDGRPDTWDTYVTQGTPGQPMGAIRMTAFDDSGSGRPERRFVYGTGGSITRVEVDPDGDGVFTPVGREPRRGPAGTPR